MEPGYLIAPWVLSVVLLSLLLLWLGTIVLHQQLISQLRSRHHILWLELGCPGAWSQAFGSAMPIFGRSAFRGLGPGAPGMNYAGWIAIKGYLMIKDDRVTSLGNGLQTLRVIGAVWALVIVVAAVARIQGYL